MTKTYRGPAEILDGETGVFVSAATVVLEPRVDRRPGCWGVVAEHDAGDLPPSLRIVVPGRGEVHAFVDWQDTAGTARIRGSALPDVHLEASA